MIKKDTGNQVFSGPTRNSTKNKLKRNGT